MKYNDSAVKLNFILTTEKKDKAWNNALRESNKQLFLVSAHLWCARRGPITGYLTRPPAKICVTLLY